MYNALPDIDIIRSLAGQNKLGAMWLFSNGSFSDFSLNGNTGTPTNLTLKKCGMTVPGSGSYMTANMYTHPTLTEFTFVIRIKSGQTGSGKYIFDTDASQRLILGWNTSTAGQLGFYTLASGWKNFGAAPNDNQCHTIIYTFDSGGTVSKCYIDGEQFGSTQTHGPFTIETSAILFAAKTLTGSFLQCDCSMAMAGDFLCDDTIASLLHSACLEIERQSNRRVYSFNRATIAPSPGKTGLVFGSNMRPLGTVLPNLGTGPNGTISGNLRHGKDMLGDYITGDGSGSVSFGNVGTVKSVSFWCTPDTTTEDFFDLDGGTHTIEVTAGTLTATGFVSPSIFVNGASSSTLVASEAQHVGISTATGISATALDAILCSGRVYMMRASSEEMTLLDAKREYKKGLAAIYHLDYGIRESVATQTDYIENTPLRCGTATVQVKGGFDARGNHYKYLEWITAGTVLLPTLYTMGDDDAGWECQYDSGGGFALTTLTVTSGAITGALGDKMVLGSLDGWTKLLKRMVA